MIDMKDVLSVFTKTFLRRAVCRRDAKIYTRSAKEAPETTDTHAAALRQGLETAIHEF